MPTHVGTSTSDVSRELSFDEASTPARGATPVDGHSYELDLEFLNPINTRDSKISIGSRSIFVMVMKTEEGPHWPRLLKVKGKAPIWLKTDFNKWVDEDDEDEEEQSEFPAPLTWGDNCWTKKQIHRSPPPTSFVQISFEYNLLRLCIIVPRIYSRTLFIHT